MHFFFALQLLAFSPFNTDAKFIVEVQNVRQHTGQIRVGLYKPCDNFPMGCKPVVSQTVEVTGSSVKITFPVKPGDYAIALFHDVNGNGKMDKKAFGIPKEPYGFSNNYHPRLSGPAFDDCRVRINETGKTISIKLI
ncbi:DUF2141 domain-containing protein [Larkinella knui]|uniref:DUF2141 domain-containing protein n=1 Tax=Larkinella knui TaxID=2025310 RepID=A0A3P1CHP4_9BACT|nr:DUF2141 domain-containing protein [Larkinella knui]RRB12785.1 DUF2141 domain-containing protein [Larkinella knui]